MKKIIHYTKILVFILLLWTLLYSFNRLFIQKSPENLMMDEFLALDENTVDLLCVGSSHAYTSFDTEVYWNDYGIPAFCISGAGQPVSSSYYYLKEAFRTQTPKVVLLEASRLNKAVGYVGYDDYIFVTNVAWMPYSENRANALKGTVMDQSIKSNLEWNLSYFHGRWTELNNQDFAYILKNDRPGTKGFNPWWNYADSTNTLTIWDPEYKIEPPAESIEYVNRIAALCEENKAKLVVYVSPHEIDEVGYGYINWYRDYFAQNNIEMIDGVQLSHEIGIEPDVDLSSGHIGYTGAVKLSKYIGHYLSDKGYVVDRREEEGYETWEKWSHYFESTADIYSLVNIKDIVSYLKSLDSLNNSITIIVYDGGSKDNQLNMQVSDIMDSLGLHIDFNSEGTPYVGILASNKVVDQLQTQVIEYRNNISNHKIEININEDKRVNILVDYDRITELGQIMTENTLQIFVYNCISGEVVENRLFYLESGTEEPKVE